MTLHRRQGRLALLRKSGGVRRGDLREILGSKLLEMWAVDGKDLREIRITTIFHLENVIATTFHDEKDRIIARAGYNILPEVAASTLGDRLKNLSKLKGRGFSSSEASDRLNRTIGPEVESRLRRALRRPTDEELQHVVAREEAYTQRIIWGDGLADGAGSVVADADRLLRAIQDLTNPFAPADNTIDHFLRSRIYAPRPRDFVGYVVRQTTEGHFMCVFTDLDSLAGYQHTHDSEWTGEYLVMTGADLVNEIAHRMPADIGILLNPGAADDDGGTDSSSMSLPPVLIAKLYQRWHHSDGKERGNAVS